MTLFSNAKRRGWLHCGKTSRSCPRITHLVFADDSQIFFRANEEEANKVKEIL